MNAFELFEIDERIKDLVDPETGEFTDPEEVDRLDMERTDLLEGVALAYKESMAMVAALAEQERAFAERKRRAQTQAEYYKMLLERGVQGEKFRTALVEVTFRKSTEVVVDNILDVPYSYTTIDIKPDKVAIKKALKNGEAVAGAHLAENTNIQIK